MWKYPDGTYRQNPPARVEYAGYIRDFADLTRAERDELGYNEAMPLKRDPFTVYETEWTKGEDLVYREVAVSAVVDGAARDEAAAVTVRNERDRLLADSDWTQLVDAPLTDEEKAVWATKRQAWRDVPQQEGFPLTVAWPE
ncbi:tail fiber assembly protein [Desulfovibrio caledoniensis]